MRKKRKESERRGRLLVNPKIQLAYWKLILVTMFLTALIIFACLYQFLDRVIIKNPHMTYENARAVLSLFYQTSLFLVIAFPSITIALLIWGLIISNKIAGPLYRLEKELGRILNNSDFGRRLQIRKEDSLKDLSGQINQLLDKIDPSQKGSA